MTARSSSRLLGVFAVAVLGLVAWLVISLSGRDAPQRPDEVIANAASEKPASALHETPLANSETEKLPTRSTAERLAVDEGPTQAELAGAVWVSGRVQFPENTPADESATVVGVGREFGSKKLHRAPVAPDGTFRVAFTPATKKAALRLEARYVFLDESKALKLDEPNTDVVLAPILGGGLRGRVKLDASAQGFAASLVGAPVEATGWKPGLSNSKRKPAKLAQDLTFEIGGLDPAIGWRVACSAKGFATVLVESTAVTAGRFEAVELAMERGAIVTGTVKDEQGNPVAGAQIHTDAQERGVAMNPRVDPSTDKDGRFTFEDLRSGDAQFVAAAKGFTLGRHEPQKLQSGREQTIAFTLSRGLSIAGVARFSDGQPAADVTVTADPKEDEQLPHGVWFDREEPSVKTDAQGRFAITGLVEGKYDLTARSMPRATDDKTSGGKRAPRTRFEDSRNDVEAGTTGLELVLESGMTLTGRVIDDLGAPVANYAIVLERRGTNPWETAARREVLSKTKDGTFSIPGVAEGSWGVQAKTKDGGESPEVALKIPEDLRPIDLVVARPSQLRGTVLDPSGTPIAGATLRIDRQDQRFRYWSNENEAKKSDERGSFEIPVRPGMVQVCALHSNWAASAKQPIEILPGTPAGPFTFQLRRGGTITGVALDRDGKPAANREINIWGNEMSQSRATDAAGKFRFERVTPGDVQVSMQPTEAELAATRDEKGQVDWQIAQQPNARKSVELADGAVVDVTLGGTSKDGLKVTGLVRGSAPLAKAKVNFYGPTGEKHGDSHGAVTDDAGRYEVQLQKPGEYNVSLERDAGGYVNLQVEIPAGPSYVLDITLPATSISGRVVDAQGATLSGIRVFAYATSKDESKAGGHGIYSTQALTKKDGTFTLTSLSPGTYTLNANADHGWGESDRELGHASAKGVELAEGASVDGIVLRFPVTGSVAGFARTRDGRPVVDAHVIAHSKDGAGPGGYGGGAQTGPDGSFRLAALAIGTYTIYAQAKDNLVSENIEVEVRAGAKSEANLVLEPGNTILVSCVDAAGKSVNTSFDVRDARGRTRQMYYFGDEAEVPVPAGTRRYTHLPDGDYTVSVRRKKGDPVEQRVSLKGGVVRDVRLQLAE